MDAAETAKANDGDVEELVELQVQEEARLETLFTSMCDHPGLDNEETLTVFFKLFDMWIQLYRLNKCAEALEKVVPICRKRGGQLHIRGVQALAFTLWKQSKFRDSIELFQEIEELMGPSAALCENMGHTYSSLGDFQKASEYFHRSIDCIAEEEKCGKKSGDKAGVLLGLGLIEDRLGHLDKALPICRESQRLFRERACGKPSSLIAKAGMSIAKILLKIAKDEQDDELRVALEEEAVSCQHENVEIFEITCGADSPLTASALRGLGEALMRRQRFTEAQANFARSYLLEAGKDAFDLLAVMEVHNQLVNVQLLAMKSGGELDRCAFRGYLPAVNLALERVRSMKQDGNAGAYYKVAGEMLAFAEDYAGAAKLLGEAVDLFRTEEQEKVDGLIQVCLNLKEFCETREGDKVPSEFKD